MSVGDGKRVSIIDLALVILFKEFDPCHNQQVRTQTLAYKIYYFKQNYQPASCCSVLLENRHGFCLRPVCSCNWE